MKKNTSTELVTQARAVCNNNCSIIGRCEVFNKYTVLNKNLPNILHFSNVAISITIYCEILHEKIHRILGFFGFNADLFVI